MITFFGKLVGAVDRLYSRGEITERQWQRFREIRPPPHLVLEAALPKQRRPYLQAVLKGFPPKVRSELIKRFAPR